MTISVDDGLRAGVTLAAAHLLNKISFWHPKANAPWGDRLWWAQTSKGLVEKTRLSPKQVKRALGELRDRGLIETERHLWNNRLQNFIRPTISALGKPGTNGMGPQGTNGTVPRGTNVKTPERTTEKTTEVSVPSHADLVEPEMKKAAAGLSSPESDPLTPRPPAPRKTVAEVLAAAKAKPPKAGPKSLGQVWVEAVAKKTGKFVPPLTAKAHGQLKQFAKHCPQDPAGALGYAIDQWGQVCNDAETLNGAWNTPALPDAGFVLKHAGVVINLWLSQQKAKAVAPAPKPPAAPAPAKPAKPPGGEKATFEEVMAIFDLNPDDYKGGKFG
jgi:hypothetical protein